MHRVLGGVAREACVAVGDHVTVYKGQRIDNGEWLIHSVATILAGNDYDVLLVCGMVMSRGAAEERITSAPPTCVWCIAGRHCFDRPMRAP